MQKARRRVGMPPRGSLAKQGYQGLKARSVNVGQAVLARVSAQEAEGARAQQADSVSSRAKNKDLGYFL